MSEDYTGKYSAKLTPNVNNPVITHNLADLDITSVTVYKIAADNTRTVVDAAFKVINRDKIQLTLTGNSDKRWIVISA